MADGVSVSVLQAQLVTATADRQRLIDEKADLNARIAEIDTAVAVLDTSINGINAALGANSPVPAIDSLSPNFYVVESTGITLTVSGSNFVATSVINLNTLDQSTTFVDANTLTCLIPDSMLAALGALAVFVRTGEPGGGTTSTLQAQVINGVPSLATIAPTTVVFGAADTALTVTGANFIEDSVIYLNEVAYDTTLVGIDLQATIPAILMAFAGADVDVRVKNPTPGGGSSAPEVLTVTAS